LTLSGQLLSGAKRLRAGAGAAAAVVDAVGAGAVPGHADEERAVVAVVGRPPVLRRRHHLLDVLLQGIEIDGLELGRVVEVHAHRIARGRVLVEHLQVQLVGPPTITSRTREAAAGAVVSVAFSRLSPARPAGHPVGTTVEVRNLFAEIPARRKFLRAESTELRHIVEIVSLLAMARSSVGFTVRADGREVLAVPPATSLAERVSAILGRDLFAGLAEVDFEEQGISISGFTSRDPSKGGARPDVRAYVNGRPVKDRGLSKALSEAYRALGHFDPRPAAVLFVDVELDMVDVNVHPAKTEVRFREPSRVFQTVVRAVRRALAATDEDGAPVNPWLRGAGGVTPGGTSGEAGEASGPGGMGDGSTGAAGPETPRWWESDATPAGEGAATFGAPLRSQPIVLGQFRDTYIVAALDGDLWLFDQHTCHERARFEMIEKRKKGERAQSQALLEPVVVAVSPALAILAEESSLDLYDLGFELESFGAGSILVRSIPHLLSGKDPSVAVTQVLRQLDEGTGTHWAVEGRTHRLAASLACHSAVRAGQKIGRGDDARDHPRPPVVGVPGLLPARPPHPASHTQGRGRPLVRTHRVEALLRPARTSIDPRIQ
jgi:DNA mismatch repair protein MutL